MLAPCLSLGKMQEAKRAGSNRNLASRWSIAAMTVWKILHRIVLITAVIAAASAGETRFTEHLISGGYAYPYGIAAVDLDGDGDLDLTSADYQPHNRLYWFENRGAGQWTRHLIQENDPQRLERHRVGDVNKDGRPDVVIVENFYGDLKWFENPPDPKDGKLWRRHYITRGGLLGAYDVDLADLDRDGDLDVAASSWRLGNRFVWYENPGRGQEGGWTAHVIDVNQAETRTVRAADFDRDGDADLLGTVSGAGIVLWYENPGDPRQPWPRHVIDLLSRPVHGQPVDIDRDGDLDVVMAAGMAAPENSDPKAHKVLWYENPGNPAHIAVWQKHPIADSFDQAFEAVGGDLDADGDVDVAATAWGPRGRVAWFENKGDPKAEWTMHLVKADWPRANQILIADLDGDGRPDLAAI